MTKPLPTNLLAMIFGFTVCLTNQVCFADGNARLEIAKYHHNFDQRMSIPSERLILFSEIQEEIKRSSRLYPPLLHQLLSDPSPRLRYQALSLLDDHGIDVVRDDLPKSVQTPGGDTLDRTNIESIAYFKKTIAGKDKVSGTAIEALGLMRIEGCTQLAETLLSSEIPFVRYSAAVAIIQFGEAELGKKVLRDITQRGDYAHNYFRIMAAERLWRMGEKQYVEAIFDTIRENTWENGLQYDILEDLTDRYFPTKVEWRNWWENYVDNAQPKPEQVLPLLRHGNFVLFIGNLSYAITPVDIMVSIDGKLAVPQSLYEGNQHGNVYHSFNLQPGEHSLEVVSDRGAARQVKNFSIVDSRWATLKYFHGAPHPGKKCMNHPSDGGVPCSRGFHIELYDERIFFR